MGTYERPSEPAPNRPAPTPGVPQAPTVRTSLEFAAVTVEGAPQFVLEAQVKFLACPDVIKTAGSNSAAVITGAPEVLRAQLEAALRHLDAGAGSIQLGTRSFPMPTESRRTG